MKTEKEEYNFNEIINSLGKDGKSNVKTLHEQMLSWGYKPKISQGKEINDWKCEYKKNKNILLILRIMSEKWNIRCKFYHLPEYINVLEKCGKNIIDKMIENSYNCGNHGGGCKGPISFSINGKEYSRCRHSFGFDNPDSEDIKNIEVLLECENSINDSP